MQLAGCWQQPRSGRWTSCSAREWTCCAPRPRTQRVAAAPPRRCSFELPRRSSRSIRSLRARRTSTHGARRCSPGGLRARRTCTTYLTKRGRPRCRPHEPRPSDVLLDGFSLAFTERRSAAAPVLARAATGFADERVSIEEVLRWGWLATAAAVMVWDYETCLAVATRGVELAREAGALTVLAVSANVLAQATRWAESSAGRHRWSLRPMPSPRRRAPGSRRMAPSYSPDSRAAKSALPV